MTTYQRIKKLASQRHLSIAELERTLKLSNGSISKWDKSMPNSKYLAIVADYFSVSTDYLLGRTDIPSFSASDEQDIQKTVNDMIKGLSNKESLAFLKNGNEEIGETDAELLRASLETVARQSLLLSRQRSKKNNDNK
ncbi:MAG TPA: helix-turn-helix domain-containing protein [Candidatus Levilactobacillus faecigallinarum]|uniref:Helix-turn-helix domain-containing protein n=1 Tax=Candidatus Levilactobacillus faecigallinarum TaxID=2838638 RepID=A0A9D1U5E2_9LACO|nr:helix-turn-helix domain-containing protein [Candidatus Levilactobacillus faecigallinarum]